MYVSACMSVYHSEPCKYGLYKMYQATVWTMVFRKRAPCYWFPLTIARWVKCHVEIFESHWLALTDISVQGADMIDRYQCLHLYRVRWPHYWYRCVVVKKSSRGGDIRLLLSLCVCVCVLYPYSIRAAFKTLVACAYMYEYLFWLALLWWLLSSSIVRFWSSTSTVNTVHLVVCLSCAYLT